MERTKKEVTQEPVLRWQRIGGGSLRLADGRILKPKQIFESKKSGIPKAFRDSVVLLDEDVNMDKIDEQILKLSKFTKVEKVKGWFDIVDQDGKAVNEKSLRNQPADELLAVLMEG